MQWGFDRLSDQLIVIVNDGIVIAIAKNGIVIVIVNSGIVIAIAHNSIVIVIVNNIVMKASNIAIRCSYYIYCRRNKQWTCPNLLNF